MLTAEDRHSQRQKMLLESAVAALVWKGIADILRVLIHCSQITELWTKIRHWRRSVPLSSPESTLFAIDARLPDAQALVDRGSANISHSIPVDQLKKTIADPFTAGRQARQRGDLTTAIACFREAIARQPDHVPAHNNLATALQATGDLDGALSAGQHAVEIAPERAILHCNLGSLWQLKGGHEQALACYRRAIELQPDLFLAHFNLGKALASQEDWDAALAALRTALRFAAHGQRSASGDRPGADPASAPPRCADRL
ncbi:tetratricopeptide repeat protein [Allochromatium palmeri]|nr:tetratricopeptide repeat protein [Allochromatium palmeri]